MATFVTRFEPIFTREGVRLPRYALEGLGRDVDLFAMLGNLEHQTQTVAAKIRVALLKSRNRDKLARISARLMLGPQRELGGIWDSITGIVAGAGSYVQEKARVAVDYAQDTVIGAPLGQTSAIRENAENIKQMAEERVATGAMTVADKNEIVARADEAIATVHNPTQVFAKVAAEEVGKEISKVAKAFKFGMPVVAAAVVGIVALRFLR